MAADVSVKVEPENVCCRAWKVKYSKLEEKRNALRQAVKLLEQQLNKIQAESLNHKKACEAERTRADLEKEEKERALSVRVLLENEVAALKSKIVSLWRSVGSDDQDGKEKIELLKARVSKGEAELKRLKELTKKEKSRADSERKNAESEKRRAEEAWKMLQTEKSKADEERKFFAIERRKAEDCRLQLQNLRKEIDEARSKLVSETLRCEEAKKELELEKPRTMKERQRADLEKAKAADQRKLAEDNYRKLMEEKDRAKKLSGEVEGGKKHIEKLQEELHDVMSSIRMSNCPVAGTDQKVDFEMAKQKDELCRTARLILTAEKAAIDVEKQRQSSKKKQTALEMLKGNNQTGEHNKALDDKDNDKSPKSSEKKRRRSGKFKKHGSGKLLEAPPALPTTDAESTKLKLLKERLKLEKTRAKHTKEVVELEKCRNDLLMQEILRMKMEFGEFSHRLDVLGSCFSPSREGMLGLEKNVGTTGTTGRRQNLCVPDSFHACCQSDNAIFKPSCISVATCDDLRQLLHREVGLPTPRGSSTDFVSGTDSKSELLPRGSNRKKLQRSAINSGMASFSDRELVGSQDRAYIVASSAKLRKYNLNLSNGDTKVRANEKFPEVCDDSVKSPHVGLRGSKVCGQKRKELLDVIESVDHMSVRSRKLHLHMEEDRTLLHGILSQQTDEPLNDAGCMLDSKQVEHGSKRKKRKVFHEKDVGKGLQHGNKIPQNKNNCGSEIRTEANISGQVPNEINGGVCFVRRADVGGSFGCNNDRVEIFDTVDGSYMKLLELDDPTDEQRYRRAIGRLVSPVLTEMDFNITESSDKEEKDLIHGVVHEKENTSTSCCLVLGEGRVDLNRLRFIVSGDGGKFLFESQHGSAYDALPKYCVISSDDKEIGSIYRIILAIDSCVVRSSLLSHPGWMLQKFLIELRKEENLLQKERICVLFSLLLVNYSVVASGTSGYSFDRDFFNLVDSFAEHINSVMSNMETRRLFMELCQVDGLLCLIEDFLVHGKIIFCNGVPSESSISADRIVEMKLDNVDGLLSSGTASRDLLVAGSIVFASICVMDNKIAFSCEASYKICHSNGSDPLLVLSILHVFAYLCGSEYLTSSRYSLLMTVLKSVVVLLEQSNLSVGSQCPLLVGELGAVVPPCASCPFSIGATSMDGVISLLLERLQKIALCGSLQPVTGEPVNLGDTLDNFSAQPDAFEILPEKGSNGVPLTESHIRSADDLFDLSELLSLVELIAMNAGWESTQSKIIPQLLKLFKSPMLESISAAVIILVGQLGRLGVKAGGFDDVGVQSLRCSLYSFLGQATTLNMGFSTQTAIATALLRLVPLDFENIVRGNTSVSQSASACAIREWFSSLTREQKTSICNLLQSATVDKS
ncbi:uncharacterized protein LOC115672513 [Syzygium oleosum]|uniref:uncharacterized protein LOC115672513 n=1 Tax=Syzygium oleosum TaxID=219896 RepID=UPI0024BA26F6|nr:uncharacterized protein LOC115672513 [Syzygium oleosum]